jgi:hypothetical protein
MFFSKANKIRNFINDSYYEAVRKELEHIEVAEQLEVQVAHHKAAAAMFNARAARMKDQVSPVPPSKIVMDIQMDDSLKSHLQETKRTQLFTGSEKSTVFPQYVGDLPGSV